VASELRAGEPDVMTLNTSLFHPGARSIGPVDPEELATNDIVATFQKVSPFSSRVIQLSASKQVDDVSAYLTITPGYGAVGTTLRAMLYRNGVGSELVAGPNYIADFGKTANDTLTVVLSNINPDYYFDVSYRLSANPGPPGVNTFEAQVVIGGTEYPFNPKTLLGAYGEYSGSIVRTQLPGIYASVGSSIYSNIIGGRLIGTFSSEVTGEQTTNAEGTVTRTLTGVISGYFDIELTEQD